MIPSVLSKRTTRPRPTFSPTLAPSCLTASPTVPPSYDWFSRSASPCSATSFASAAITPRKSVPFATKSVSQFSSTTAPVPSSTTTSTAPSCAARPARFAAPARPWARSQPLAASRSPSVASSARLQSSMPAPVCLRSAAMSLAEISAIASALARGRLGRLLRDRLGGGRALGRPVAGGVRGRRRLLLRVAQSRLALLLGLGGFPGGPPLRVGLAALFLRVGRGRLLLGLGGRLAALLLGEDAALLDGVGDDAAHERGGPDGVVVAGNDVVNDVRVAVRVDHGDDRDAEAVGLGHRDVLLLGVDHEDRVRQPLEAADAAKVPLELREIPGDLQRFFLGHLRRLARLDETLELTQLRDARVDRLEVRERPAQPAVVDVRHATALGLVLDRLLGLLLGADEQDRAAALDGAPDEPVRGVDPLEGLLQIDDVDAVALTEDETAHLRVPTARLVAEVDAGLQQLLHGDDSHGVSPSVVPRPAAPVLRTERPWVAGVRILGPEPELASV